MKKNAVKYKQRCEKLEQTKSELTNQCNQLQIASDEMKIEILELKTQLQTKEDEIKLLQQRKDEVEQSLQVKEALNVETKEFKDKIEVLENEISTKEEKNS